MLWQENKNSGLVVPSEPVRKLVYGPLEFTDENDRKAAEHHLGELVRMLHHGIKCNRLQPSQAMEDAIRHLAKQLLGDVDFEIPT